MACSVSYPVAKHSRHPWNSVSRHVTQSIRHSLLSFMPLLLSLLGLFLSPSLPPPTAPSSPLSCIFPIIYTWPNCDSISAGGDAAALRRESGGPHRSRHAPSLPRRHRHLLRPRPHAPHAGMSAAAAVDIRACTQDSCTKTSALHDFCAVTAPRSVVVSVGQ